MLTLAAFVLALALLIAVHEYGHYRVAIACGVKVLRFSIGFGTPLFRWMPKGSSTEFVLAAFPVGGYVKMLDEREAPVSDEERHLAFNTQPLRSRVAIVAAGPVANLLLAVLFYAVVNWSGVQLPAAIMASPAAGSVAALAGLIGGEEVHRIGFDGDDLQAVDSFEDVRWYLTRGALEGRNVRMAVSRASDHDLQDVLLKLNQIDASEANAELFKKIGILGPFSRPVIGEVTKGAAAEKAGLQNGDLVLQVGSVHVVDGLQLRQLIRSSVVNTESASTTWKINRAGIDIDVIVKSDVRQEGELWVGKIGAYVGEMPEMIMLRYGPLDGLWRGMVRTWDVSALTLKMMGKMVLGEASLKNLSGPLTIADYAGKSAGMGVTQYLLNRAL